jgi:hypothetical protein
MLNMMNNSKKGKLAAMLVGSVSKDNTGNEVESEANEYGFGLEAAMNKLIVAMQKGDIHEAAEAFTEAFKICEMQPHEEYEG